MSADTGSTPLELHFTERDKNLVLTAKDKVRVDHQLLADLEKYNITITLVL